MVVNPDDLLIFKMRPNVQQTIRQKSNQQPAKPAKQMQQQQAVQPQQSSQPQSKQVQQATPAQAQPMQANAPQPQAQAAQPQAQQQAAQQPVPYKAPEAKPQPQEVNLPPPPPPPPVTYKQKGNVPPPEARKPASSYLAGNEPYVSAAPAIEMANLEAKLEEEESHGGKKQEKNRKRYAKTKAASRKAAQGLQCTWHPWREAYAICNYCHRPFCFEDLVSQNGYFYCLEDIDKAAGAGESQTKQPAGINYSAISIVSGVFFIATFVVFLVFESNNLINTFSYANSIGIITFFRKMNIGTALFLLSSLFVLLAFISSFVVVLRSRGYYSLGMLSGLAVTALFGYNYIVSSTLYSLVIAVAGFVSIVTLAAAHAGLSNEEFIAQKMKYNEPAPELQFSNVGRF